jgi:hypothetical protein
LTAPVEPVDDRRHAPGPEVGWQESWDFDFVAAGGSLGGYVRLTLVPGTGRSWYWAGLVGEGRPFVVVVDDEAPLPGAGLELRAEGLWCDHTCEVALDHWTLGLEAFAVALDDPAEAWRAAVGERVALGLDLEWETRGPPVAEGAGAYTIPCAVLGEVLVGAERIEVDGHGQRDHRWGEASWWSVPWWSLTGRLDDGTALAARDGAGATVWAPGEPARSGPFAPPRGDGGSGLIPDRVALPGAGLDVVAEVRYRAPVPVTGPAATPGRLARALCDLRLADGRRGSGWVARHQPG